MIVPGAPTDPNLATGAMPGTGIAFHPSSGLDNPHEAAEVQQWMTRIARVQINEGVARMKMVRWRKVLQGEGHAIDPTVVPDGIQIPDRRKDETNLIYSIFEAALPHVYDESPDVTVSPSRSVDDTHYELARHFAETATILLQRLFVNDGGLRDRMRDATRTGFHASLGWLKMAYAREYDSQPYMKMAPEDAQDEIARLHAASTRLVEAVDPTERTMLVSEIAALRQAVFEQRDVLVDEGIVIDWLDPLDVVLSPEVVTITNGWWKAEWIAQGMWLSPTEAAARYRMDDAELRSARHYTAAQMTSGLDRSSIDAFAPKPGIQDGPMSGPGEGMVRGWEIWHTSTRRVLTAVEGLRRWARPPMQPERRPQRWVPFYPLGFNKVPGVRYPIGDVGLLEGLQQEFTDTREKFYDHRKAVIPITLVDGSKLSPEDTQKVNDAPVGARVVVKGTVGPEAPLRNALAVPEAPLPNPLLYDTSTILGDMRLAFGIGDTQMGSVVQPKTATEAREQAGAVSGRMNERTNEVVMVETMMAEDALEMLLQEVSLERARRYAGASAVWPQLDRATIFDLVSVQVAHQSRMDREAKAMQWMEIGPQVRSLVMEVAQLRMAGMDMIAQPLIEILRETLRRFDDRVDIERFLPGGPVQAGVPIPPQLQDAAAAGVAPVSGAQLQILMQIAGTGAGGPPGARAGPGQPGAGPQAGRDYNPGSGGMGTPQPAGAANQPSGVV